MISVPLHYLLRRPQSYYGLVLLAMSSVLLGPITLEVIFNHRDLWFTRADLWQSMAFSWVWLVWNTLGMLLTLAWGLDRKFNGLQKKLHQHYAILLSVSAVFVYNLFALPTWYWLWSMNLVEGWGLIESIVLSYLIMTLLSIGAIYIEEHFSSLLALFLGVCCSVVISWFTWHWIAL